MENEIQLDMAAAIQALRHGKDISGKDGVPTLRIKQMAEAAMKAGLDAGEFNFEVRHFPYAA